MEEKNMTTVYRAIYENEFSDFSDTALLAQKEHMTRNFCEENYNGKNTFNYREILEKTGVENPDESFLFFFKDKDFAEDYAKSLFNYTDGKANVYSFQFANDVLEACKGLGTYERGAMGKQETQEEYAIPLSLYDPQKNLIGPAENQNTYSYDPDNYDFFF